MANLLFLRGSDAKTGGMEPASCSPKDGRSPSAPSLARATRCAVCMTGTFLSLSCAPLETLELPTLPAHTRSNREEQEGLTIAAQLVVSAHLARYHFGADLRKEGYLPVLVSFENRGNTSFEVERHSCSVVLESGEKLEPAAPEEIYWKIRRSTLPAYVFAPLVVPAIWLHARIEEFNFNAAKTLYGKSLPRSLRIEGNDPPVTRVVFFSDPSGTLRQPRSFSSSVLHLVVGVEGSKPADTDRSPPDAVAVETSDTGVPRNRPASERVVGRSLTFTVALDEEDA